MILTSLGQENLTGAWDGCWQAARAPKGRRNRQPPQFPILGSLSLGVQKSQIKVETETCLYTGFGMGYGKLRTRLGGEGGRECFEGR